jgi:hypothetical protein
LGDREQEYAHRAIHAPDRDQPVVKIPRLLVRSGVRRPIIRRGRAPRRACNARARGSRRGLGTSSRAGPGDSETDLDGESDGLPPPRGSLDHGWTGGGA